MTAPLSDTIAWSATAIALDGRALLIEGAPGSGKSSLALALIDRGARLVGDDAVILVATDGVLRASAHPNVAGLIEMRNVGLIAMPTVADVPVALVIRLDPAAPRYVEQAERTVRASIDLPLVRLWPDSPVLALRAEMALSRHGLGRGASNPDPCGAEQG